MSTTGDESDDSSTFHSEDEVRCIFAKTNIYSSTDDDEDTSAVKGTTEQFSKLPPPSLTEEERQDVILFVRRQAELWIFPHEARDILRESYNDVYSRILLLGDQNASHVFVCRTMSVLPDISCSKSVPRTVMCDICVFYPSKPVMVLTFTTQATNAASRYNSNVAKAVMVYINNDLLENLTVVNGVIDMSKCTLGHLFLSRISELETSAKDFAIPNNMKMDEDTALRVLTSFLKMFPKADRIDTDDAPKHSITSLSSTIGGGKERRRSKEKSYHAMSKRTDKKIPDRAQSKVNAYNRLSKRDGKRRDTPEKSTTPSQEENSENRPPSRNVIWNEEIEKLQIKDDDLQKIHEPRPPAERKKTPVSSTVTVRKLKPPAELEKPRPKIVTVAKPAPPDAPLKPIDYSGFAGPRYNPDGSVIQHSILGSYNDFHRQAVKKGDLIDIPSPRELDTQPSAPTLKYEKKRKMMKDNIRAQADENNALKNWQLRMIERKRQQGYISKLLQKSPEDLAMNQADNFRSIQEQRHIIDRTIPTMDYGKGYRVGSEYWKQQERFGDETVGIHMTLTQTEKGYPVPVEHVGLPQTVRKEKGCPWSPNYTVPVFYPWHKAPFYEKRKKQLQSVIDELDPHQPEFDQLEVIGTNDPFRGRAEIESDSELTERLESEDRYLGLGEGDEGQQDPLQDHPDVYPEPVFGPSLQIAGQPARWTGDSHGFIGQPGIQARISFESYTSERITSYLEIVNDGTTSIYYDWKQLPKDNPFELVQATVQRFYFNNSSGVILPGETMKFPFVFKSPNAGVFTEQWKFETRPVVCGGADLIVSLRGVALQEDIYQKQRQELEKDLQTKQANQVVTQILDELIDAIRMPDRPQSPVDAYITEEEIFRRHNQGMHYSHETVVELKQIYLQLFPEEERVGKFWDLCVQDLKDLVMDLDEDDENKEPFLHRINEAVGKMSYTPNHPIQQQLYKIGYEYLIEAVDGIVGQSMFVRHILGMPEKEIEEFPESDLSDSRRGKTADKSKADGKDKKGAPGKDPKAAKSGKETPKPDPKKAPPGPKKPPSRGPVATPGPVERAATPVSTPSSPTPYADPVLERKYREKLYCQAYTVIGEAIDRMDQAFADMLKNNTLDRLRPV